jgi:hypothetical protein
MNAAELAARKAMLAALEAARVVMRDTVNAASATLNAAVLGGDSRLVPIVETLTAVVVTLNGYRPKLQAEIAATDAMVPDPEPEPEPQPTDWATRSANRKLALRLMSAGPEDANLAGRHPTATRGIWDDNKGTRFLPVIDDNSLRFDVVPGLGVADWYTDLGARYGPNSVIYVQFQMWLSPELLNTVFEMTGGGYPGIKLAVLSSLNATSDSQKLVLSTLNGWNLVYFYQYWGGNTANLYAPIPSSGGRQDVQPIVGEPPSCIYPLYATAPRGTTPPGCKGLTGGIWTTVDIKVESGEMFPDRIACLAERWLWLTGIDGVKRLTLHYGKDTPGYIGRNADPFEAIWFAPYMTGKSATQQHPVATMRIRELIVDDKPIPPPKFELPVIIIPGTLPEFVPPSGTFAKFTLNVPNNACPPTMLPGNDIKRIFSHWNSAAMIHDYSPRGGIGYHGGGEHGSGAAQDSVGVMVLNLETRKYEFRCRGTRPFHQATGAATDVDRTNEFGEYADGSPAAPHTCNQAVEFPSAWGGGPRGSFMRAGGTAGSSTVNGDAYRAYIAAGGDPNSPIAPVNGDNAYNTVHAFDLSQDILGTRRMCGSIRYGAARDWGGNYAAACIDRKRQGWWLRMGTYAPTMTAFLSKDGQLSYPSAQTSTMQFPSLQHFTHDGQDVLMCLYFADSTKDFMQLMDLGAGFKWEPRRASGIVPITHPTSKMTTLGYLGLRWSNRMKRLVALDYSKAIPTLVYLIPSDPARLMTSQWEFRYETITSADGSRFVPNDGVTDYGSSNGSWGKLIEIEEWGAWAWTRNAAEPGILVRPQAMT